MIRISKNHIINNLVEAYLRANPSKKRPEEDLQVLDAKNKVIRDVEFSEVVCTKIVILVLLKSKASISLLYVFLFSLLMH